MVTVRVCTAVVGANAVVPTASSVLSDSVWTGNVHADHAPFRQLEALADLTRGAGNTATSSLENRFLERPSLLQNALPVSSARAWSVVRCGGTSASRPCHWSVKALCWMRL